MQGRVDEYRRCWTEITIIGIRDQLSLEAMIDTGFDGWLCLPVPIAIHLGLELCGSQTIELADGTRKRELVFTSQVIFDSERKPVDIILTESEDALVGTGMLADSVLIIDFVDRTMEIARKGR